MSPGATFERVYHALKEQLGSGRYASGQHLEPAALSQDLCASITPVRDALHRLVGEGLVEAPRGDGFRTPAATEVGLRHLYRWNAAVLDLAARSRCDRGPDAADEAAETVDILQEVERLFLEIGARSGNPEHAGAVARLNDRLRPIRRVELDLIPGLDDEIGEMADRLAEDSLAMLRRSISAFHRRRERIVGDIVAALVARR